MTDHIDQNDTPDTGAGDDGINIPKHEPAELKAPDSLQTPGFEPAKPAAESAAPEPGKPAEPHGICGHGPRENNPHYKPDPSAVPADAPTPQDDKMGYPHNLPGHDQQVNQTPPHPEYPQGQGPEYHCKQNQQQHAAQNAAPAPSAGQQAPPPPYTPGNYPPPGGAGQQFSNQAPPPPPHAGPGAPGNFTRPGAPGQNSPASIRNWTMLIHLSGLCQILGIPSVIGPLIFWMIKKDESPVINAHGKAAVNFQLSVTIYFIISFILAFAFIGILLIPAVGILWLVCTIIASTKANEGILYKYPFTIPFLK